MLATIFGFLSTHFLSHMCLFTELSLGSRRLSKSKNKNPGNTCLPVFLFGCLVSVCVCVCLLAWRFALRWRLLHHNCIQNRRENRQTRQSLLIALQSVSSFPPFPWLFFFSSLASCSQPAFRISVQKVTELAHAHSTFGLQKVFVDLKSRGFPLEVIQMSVNTHRMRSHVFVYSSLSFRFSFQFQLPNLFVFDLFLDECHWTLCVCFDRRGCGVDFPFLSFSFLSGSLFQFSFAYTSSSSCLIKGR